MAFWKALSMFMLVLGLAQTQCPAPFECPPMWTRYGNHCYRFFGHRKTWVDAEAHCGEFFTRFGQSHLASIHSEGEDNFLKQYWTNSLIFNGIPDENDRSIRVWLGLTDQAEEGTFTWSDQTYVDYQGWRTDGQPDDAGISEDCVEFWLFRGQLGWNDIPCSRTVPYICKMPAV